MRLTPASSQRNAVRAFAVAAVALGLVAATWIGASAAPQALPVSTPDAPLSATIESSATAVPVSGDFGYTVHIRLSEPASYMQTRIRVRRPSGRLVFQRTKVENGLPSGLHSASFGRSLDGLSLGPGAYPVEIEIRADMAGSTVTTDLATTLLVFDPAEKRAGSILVTHVNAVPFEAPDGRLALDPAVATKARDDVTAIASLILTDPAARLTLSIPPLTLAEWGRIADGYELSDGRTVPSSDPTPASYAAALELLGSAIETGRLELLSTGFADPDISQLAAQGLIGDITPHYEQGLSTTFASLETSPSTGTVPAGACVPPTTLTALKILGIGYIVEDTDCARSGDSTVAAGMYPVKDTEMRVALSDVQASDSLTSGDTTSTIERVANRQITAPTQPMVMRLELTDSGLDASETVLPLVHALEKQPWTHLSLGRDATPPRSARAVRLTADRIGTAAPRTYWATVSRARVLANALSSALGPSDNDAISAQRDSLVAESSAWAGPNGSWAGASRGQQFAAASLRTSRGILDTVGIKIESITLPSARGTVPVSLQNGTNETLQVTVRTTTEGGIEVEGPDTFRAVMRPQETFVQIPVNMHSALSGKLTVEVLAGTVPLAERTVDVHASYLDRLAIIGGIVLALGILLALIVRRVRAAERAELAAARVAEEDERYTDAQSDTDEDVENQ